MRPSLSDDDIGGMDKVRVKNCGMLGQKNPVFMGPDLIASP